MKIQILGTGCAKCHKLENNAREAVAGMGVDAEVEKVTDLDAIISYGVMMTPALAIDGQVKITGKVPDVADIRSMISEAITAQGTAC